jgi:hypothetical protein
MASPAGRTGSLSRAGLNPTDSAFAASITAFLITVSLRWSGAALILIFAIATFVDLSVGGQPVRFAYYAETVAIMVFLDLEMRRAVAGLG